MINWIILGLGNPGEKFENTRHNISWWVLDILSNKLSGYKKYEKKTRRDTIILLLKVEGS